MATGQSHTCAVADSAAFCWGLNTSGQLGDGSVTNEKVATAVAGLTSDVSQIATGQNHSCALVGTSLKCWGLNSGGQIGKPTMALYPVPVSMGSNAVTSVATGNGHSCALTVSTSVLCWGANTSGQLGNGTTAQSYSPTEVVMGEAGGPGMYLTGVSHVSTGQSHTCAVMSDGGLLCWGENGSGQLGVGSTDDKAVPTLIAGLSNVTLISAGQNHTCALDGGDLKCWGQNLKGQLGDGTISQRNTPTQVLKGAASGTGTTLSGALGVSTGGFHTCAIDSAGEALCWGLNGSGQLGYGSSGAGTDKLVPTLVTGLTPGVTQVSAGGSHSCAIDSGENLLCWGANGNGQLGTNSLSQKKEATPVLKGAAAGIGTNLSGVAQVSTGAFHTCASMLDGGLLCWGDNQYGQLGDNSKTQRLVPTEVPGFTSGVISIAAGQGHSCGVFDGAVKCWGVNSYGQLGSSWYATTAATPLPVTTTAEGEVP